MCFIPQRQYLMFAFKSAFHLTTWYMAECNTVKKLLSV